MNTHDPIFAPGWISIPVSQRPMCEVKRPSHCRPRSQNQRATDRLLGVLARLGAGAGWALKLPGARGVIQSIDGLIQEGLFGVG